MDNKYFKELEPYSKSYLLEKFNQNIFDELLKKGLLLELKNCDNSAEKCYKFKFVGLIILDEIILNCCPKYFPINYDKNDFNEVINVIKHFDDETHKLKKSFDYGINDFSVDNFNLISVMLFFIEDYFENGVYTNYQNIFEINGYGEIDWNRTINDNFPIIAKNKPYYVEFKTRGNYNDLSDYFRLLHEFIITDCSNYLKNTGLLDVFGLTSVELSENILENFGQIDYILNKLSRELKVEYNTHKRKLLSLMYAYLKHKNSFEEENSFVVYGTSSYHTVWEYMCKKIFADKLGKKLSVLFPESYDGDDTLMSIIDTPKWFLDKKQYHADKTLIPDIITFHEHDNKNYFIIFDAKYYQYELKGDKIEHQPGIRSVTKQYLYQLAYNDFIKINGFDEVRNAFLLPKYNGEVENKGFVELNILSNTNLDLENIRVIMLPAHEVNQLFLSGGEMDISMLKLY